jgi:uracil-DNA glycosylase
VTSQVIKLSQGWLQTLQAEFEQDYMQTLLHFLSEQAASGKQIHPKRENIFNALNCTPLHKVRVVILGQDPYHGPGQAHGLSFSVLPGVPTPPSLKNIYKELITDIGIAPPSHGHLQSWAEQGVLMLNAVLTVEHAQAASHQGKGWELFTDRVIDVVNQQCTNVVFLLWGAYAQKKGSAIDRSKHLVLQAPHPSPLSAYRGFFGCRHFSQTNTYLQQKGAAPIDWQIR